MKGKQKKVEAKDFEFLYLLGKGGFGSVFSQRLLRVFPSSLSCVVCVCVCVCVCVIAVIVWLCDCGHTHHVTLSFLVFVGLLWEKVYLVKKKDSKPGGENDGGAKYYAIKRILKQTVLEQVILHLLFLRSYYCCCLSCFLSLCVSSRAFSITLFWSLFLSLLLSLCSCSSSFVPPILSRPSPFTLTPALSFSLLVSFFLLSVRFSRFPSVK